jgi:hypothetical protein
VTFLSIDALLGLKSPGYFRVSLRDMPKMKCGLRKLSRAGGSQSAGLIEIGLEEVFVA